MGSRKLNGRTFSTDIDWICWFFLVNSLEDYLENIYFSINNNIIK